MRTRGSIAFSVARDERGIALPLALIGLICVTLMITAALLTSSTEAAISGAHKDAVSDLYVAESGVQRYVATAFAQTAPFSFLPQPSTSTITVGSGSSARQVQIGVAEVLRMPSPGASAGPSAYVSVAATPLDGGGRPRGRTISSLLYLTSTISNLNLNVNAGVSVATDLTVTGNSKIIDNSALCADKTTNDNAIEHSQGTTVTKSGNGTISGDVEQLNLTQAEFRARILGGRTLEQYANLAEIKFGPKFGTPAFNNGTKPRSSQTNMDYNWGCPKDLGAGCDTGPYTARYPVVAIDASQMTNKLVHLTGDHGQGTLIVLGGHLKITGNFIYKGIILIEGALEMKGTGSESAKLEGTVAAFGAVDGKKNQLEDSETSGNAMIRYNRCEVAAAIAAFNNNQMASPQWAVPDQNPTFAWYELVR
jgi:hypothetical protein